MNAITEMAKILKERENPSIQGICIGKVISAPPQITIAVNGFILGSSNIVIAAHLLPSYKRNTSPTVTVSSASVGDHGSHSHSVGITDITFTDTLKAGDRVIVMVSVDDSTYFILDKVGDI